MPQMLSMPRLLPGRYQFTFGDLIGTGFSSNMPAQFRIQFTTNLSEWHDLDSQPLRSNGQSIVEDPLLTLPRNRYYRVLEP